MPKQVKFRISPAVVEAIGQSPVSYADIYRRVGSGGKPRKKRDGTWRRLTGRVPDRDGEFGVPFATFQQFCVIINELMGWDKALEELCHADDRQKLIDYQAAINPAPPRLSPRDDSSPAEDDSTALPDQLPRNEESPVLSLESALIPHNPIAAIELPAAPSPVALGIESVPHDVHTAKDSPNIHALAGTVQPSLLGRWHAFAVGAAVLLCVSGVLTTTWMLRNLQTRQPQAISQLATSADTNRSEVAGSRDAQAQAAAAGATVNAIIDFLRFDALGPPAKDTPEQQQISHRHKLAELSKKAGTRFRGQPLAEANVRMALGAALHAYREIELAEIEFERVIDLRTRHLGPEHADTLEAKHQLAVCYINAMLGMPAIAILEKVVQARQRELGGMHPATVVSRDLLAQAYATCCNWDDAAKVWQELLNQMEAENWDIAAISNTKRRLAFMYHYLGQPDNAESLFLEVLAEQRQRLGRNHSDTLLTVHQMACLYLERKKLEPAERMQQEVVERLEENIGSEHYQTLAAKEVLASIYGQQDRQEMAEALCLQVLAGQQRMNGLCSHPP